MLVLQVARLDEYPSCGIYQKKTYSKLVKCKEKCCFETLLFIKHAWETTIVACIFVWWCCSIGFSGLVVVIIVVVWFLSLCMSHAIHTRFSTTYIKDDKHTRISKMIDNRCNRKTKGSKLWLADCCLVMASKWRIHKWWQTKQEYAHTTHNPYYGCCAVKSNHNNFLLIAWLVLTLYVWLILSDKPTLFSFLIWPSDDDAATLLFTTVLLFFLTRHSFVSCYISSLN
jgi:hypothetical protein